MEHFSPTKSTLTNEGCDIHYWHQGNGPLLIFLPGGNGHGRQYDAIITALSDRYTCATFDRRQMSASQAAVNKRLSPPQQARDVRAIITALGCARATLFGSSLGGILAFQFAVDFPGMVDHIIAHEAPTHTLLPNATHVFEFLYRCLEVCDESGVDAAQEEFATCLVGYFDAGVPRTGPAEPRNTANHWANEAPVLLGYLPNLVRIRENGTSVGVMRGVRSRDAWYALAVEEQAKILDCPKLDVAGAHEGFRVECEAFLPYFIEMMAILEKRKSGRL